MYTRQHSSAMVDAEDQNFDDLMADLFVLVTHHSLTQCENTLPKIIEYIHCLTQHDDIECYPEQLKVLLKMRTLWRTRLFRAEMKQLKH